MVHASTFHDVYRTGKADPCGFWLEAAKRIDRLEAPRTALVVTRET